MVLNLRVTASLLWIDGSSDAIPEPAVAAVAGDDEQDQDAPDDDDRRDLDPERRAGGGGQLGQEGRSGAGELTLGPGDGRAGADRADAERHDQRLDAPALADPAGDAAEDAGGDDDEGDRQ